MIRLGLSGQKRHSWHFYRTSFWSLLRHGRGAFLSSVSFPLQWIYQDPSLCPSYAFHLPRATKKTLPSSKNLCSSFENSAPSPSLEVPKLFPQTFYKVDDSAADTKQIPSQDTRCADSLPIGSCMGPGMQLFPRFPDLLVPTRAPG